MTVVGRVRSRRPRTVAGTFAQMKWTLLRNGWKRSMRTGPSAVGTALAFVLSTVASVIGFMVAAAVRFFDPVAFRLSVVAGATLVVGLWWFAPLLAGGVDETVDPTKLTLLPLTPPQLRRGQIAAGLVGLAPMASMFTMSGLLIGTTRRSAELPFAVAAVVMLIALGVIGSRTIATTLAGLATTRRGGDLAAVLAAVGGASVFAGLQLFRFADQPMISDVVDVIRWTPPGIVAEGLVRPHGLWSVEWWRIGVGVIACWAAARWWSARLDRMLVEVPRPGRVRRRHRSGLAILDGTVRRHLPPTPAGAAIARELVYMARSAGRRAVLASATLMGVAYVVAVAFSVPDRPQRIVLAAPVGAIFGMQHGVNQLGVDPQAFWMEMVTAPSGRARLVGRQLLCLMAVVPPVIAGGVLLAWLTGGWSQLVVAVGSVLIASPALAGLGSAISPFVVTPAPDTSNPFALRRTSGHGCLAALGGFLFVGVVAILVSPLEALMWHLVAQGQAPMAVLCAVVGALGSAAVWWSATGFAVSTLAERDDAVFLRLDARAQA